MSLDQKIIQDAQKLPNSLQEELLDFILNLLLKAERQETQEWSSFSLSSAMRGMENEEQSYTLDDIKVEYK